jgi:hypothetical protein
MGLWLEEYVEAMDQHQAAMLRRLDEVSLTAEDQRYFGQRERPRYVLVMTEDWCGDSLMNLPIVARIVEAAPQMELRIFVRSRAADLNRYYEERGITNIPAVTFLDEAFGEIGTWVERPQAGHSRVEAWAAARPGVIELYGLYGDPSLTAEERRRLFDERFPEFKTEMEAWYEEGLQQAMVDEIKALLSETGAVHSL